MDGTEVRATYFVRGTAEIPNNSYLWVFLRREDFEGVWWPQRRAKIKRPGNTWKVSATFGQRVDIGWDFDVAVAAVTQKSHLKLKDYYINAVKSGHWPPIEMPDVVCPPVIRSVSKVGH